MPALSAALCGGQRGPDRFH